MKKTKNACWEIANNEFIDPTWYDSYEDMVKQIKIIAELTYNKHLMNKVYELINSKLGEKYNPRFTNAIDLFFLNSKTIS